MAPRDFWKFYAWKLSFALVLIGAAVLALLRGQVLEVAVIAPVALFYVVIAALWLYLFRRDRNASR